jgi:hypothetical protein
MISMALVVILEKNEILVIQVEKEKLKARTGQAYRLR